uniref:NADH-ubiquinone oxidoreductase chain 6 n=1 Tax=Spilopyra sumptuosa TaxID=284356 RepID=U3KZT6_9CUCU|nr:NADH dehydrogenase subunit 6 [Spilopyra sumptuosa]QUB07186.1 NADH dehydrogenase subunit 6 [Spilopyra sumptuosa]
MLWMTYLMMISLIFMINFLFLNHPLSLGLILLCQTITISLMTGLMSPNFWFSYILFLIMIGGMLILFIYMTNISSNEKFKYSQNLMLLNLFFMLIMMLMIYYELNFFNLILNLNEMNLNFKKINISFSKYFSYPNNMITYMLIIYLFITLIMVSKITKFNKGPLRKNY